MGRTIFWHNFDEGDTAFADKDEARSLLDEYTAKFITRLKPKTDGHVYKTGLYVDICGKKYSYKLELSFKRLSDEEFFEKAPKSAKKFISQYT